MGRVRVMANIPATYRVSEIGNGVCEISKDGVDALCMATMKTKRTKKDHDKAVTASAIAAGFIGGMALGCGGIVTFLVCMAWVGIVVLANR